MNKAKVKAEKIKSNKEKEISQETMDVLRPPTNKEKILRRITKKNTRLILTQRAVAKIKADIESEKIKLAALDEEQKTMLQTTLPL